MEDVTVVGTVLALKAMNSYLIRGMGFDSSVFRQFGDFTSRGTGYAWKALHGLTTMGIDTSNLRQMRTIL
jgi:hypothetical protein